MSSFLRIPLNDAAKILLFPFPAIVLVLFFKFSLPKLANIRIKLRHLPPELRIRRVGVAAVLLLHPLRTFEETAHFLVVATVAEVTDKVDE